MKPTETKLLTVQVPLDATNISFNVNNLRFEHDTCTTCLHVEADDLICIIHKENGQIVFSPGFEPEKYVDSQEIWGYDSEEAPTFDIMYRNYNESEEHWKLKCDQYSKATDSFLSRIKAENGVYFDNPLGEKCPEQMILTIKIKTGIGHGCCGHPLRNGECCGNAIPVPIEEPYEDYDYNPDWIAWQEAESNVVKNKLVVLGVKKS